MSDLRISFQSGTERERTIKAPRVYRSDRPIIKLVSLDAAITKYGCSMSGCTKTELAPVVCNKNTKFKFSPKSSQETSEFQGSEDCSKGLVDEAQNEK